jgi:hypothetical protein
MSIPVKRFPGRPVIISFAVSVDRWDTQAFQFSNLLSSTLAECSDISSKDSSLFRDVMGTTAWGHLQTSSPRISDSPRRSTNQHAQKSRRIPELWRVSVCCLRARLEEERVMPRWPRKCTSKNLDELPDPEACRRHRSNHVQFSPTLARGAVAVGPPTNTRKWLPINGKWWPRSRPTCSKFFS